MAPLGSAEALAGGQRAGRPGGREADADLDAVTALFDVAEQYVSRTAGASLRGLVDHVRALGSLPAARRPRRPTSTAVTVLSAHAALGREWDVVVIAGLQEGLWPNTTPRGGVLGTQQLVDVLDGVVATTADGVSSRAPLLAEERRLLIAAMGRARSRLLVTAVDSECGDDATLPSPFFDELAAVRDRHRDPAPPSPCSPRGCWPPRRWSAGCARWSAHPRVPSTMRYALVPQRNWRGWPRPGCPVPTRRSGTA